MENGQRNLEQIVVLIPALDPDEKLMNYVMQLCKIGWKQIIVIDDGSCEKTQKIFSSLSRMQGVHVLHHDVNKGKGRALKTGFIYCMENYPDCVGVVTADSDGQHSVRDVVSTAEMLWKNPSCLILGTRNFNKENVPWRSSFGNKTTTAVFHILYGKKINDTQTGLRGVGMAQIKDLISVKGERFEYEIRMLIQTAREKRNIIEVPIETIYLEENKSSHFRPVKDSLRIYSVIFGSFFAYLFSSLSSALVDMLVFALLNGWVLTMLPQNKNITIATFGARVISSTFNFVLNHKVVFATNKSMAETALKYYGLVLIQMCCSAGFVVLFAHLLPWNTLIIKMIVDSCLFLISFQVQQHFVFGRKAVK